MRADFDEIKRTTDLRAVVERYGIALRREGKDWRGKCPFHDDEKRPNFIVSPDKGLWRCPACGAAGNVIQFVARMESLTEREAALKLLCTVPGVSRASDLPSPAVENPGTGESGRDAACPCGELLRKDAGQGSRGARILEEAGARRSRDA